MLVSLSEASHGCYLLAFHDDGEAACLQCLGVGVFWNRCRKASQGRVKRNMRSFAGALALLEDEATCKTLNITPDGVWLMPENPAYPPIDGTGCQILGVVKAVYREY